MADILDYIPGGSSAKQAAEIYYANHVMQLYYLWQSGNLLVNTSALFKGKTLTTAQLAAFDKQIDVTKKQAVHWMMQQTEIELDGGEKLGINIAWFFSAAGLQKIKNILNKLASERIQGIGFVPLIIAGVVALVALWGVFKIVQRLTTTVADKQELLLTTAQTAKDLGLTPQQAAGLLSQTQAEASAGGLSGMVPWIVGGILAVTVLPGLLKSKSTT